MTHDPAFLADCQAFLDGAALVDLSDRAEVDLTGKDAQSLMHNLSTNEFKKLGLGGGCESFVLDVKGKIVGHVFAFVSENLATLDSAPGQGARLAAHFNRYIIREQVEPTDRTGERAKILVAGPKAADVLASLVPGELPTEPYAHREIDPTGAATLRRVPWTVGGGWLVVAPRESRDAWFEKLVAAGARQCSSQAWEAVRVESGLPLYGIDVAEENLPQEVDRNSQAISFVKGCYLGQETVARIDALGHVNKLLRAIKLPGDSPAPVGTELRRGEKVIGKLTSSVWSPRFGSIGLAYVRREGAAEGASVETSLGPATVHKLPLTQ